VGLILLPLQAPPGRASMAPVLITLREAALFRGVAWCELGILALIATPMAVVLIAIATYARARQWAYVGAGVVVLAVWIASQVWS